MLRNRADGREASENENGGRRRMVAAGLSTMNGRHGGTYPSCPLSLGLVSGRAAWAACPLRLIQEHSDGFLFRQKPEQEKKEDGYCAFLRPLGQWEWELAGKDLRRVRVVEQASRDDEAQTRVEEREKAPVGVDVAGTEQPSQINRDMRGYTTKRGASWRHSRVPSGGIEAKATVIPSRHGPRSPSRSALVPSRDTSQWMGGTGGTVFEAGSLSVAVEVTRPVRCTHALEV
ncbi:hypothetical protein B0T18DRAFT_386825 [Schizothecium vesticola]|uniref:Uncharacterized protein n=1 Tax=Schizothecium vesticola TaxID=314040 RepID=A0AA40FC26_9PEZI|nr:hypothetical protein B0T18DRAFT_386825 [Schizothecium vesticola]